MDEHLLTQQQMEAIQKNGFKTEMFGFHRAQVLSYLESLSQQYAQQEAELRARAEELQAQVLSAQNMLRESSARENALTVSRDEQARRVHMAQAETQAFRAELLSTREEIHTLHAKLEETEKSLTALQKERDELLASNDGMAAQLQQVRDSLAQQRARADQESRRAKEEMVSAQIRAAELAQKANAQAEDFGKGQNGRRAAFAGRRRESFGADGAGERTGGIDCGARPQRKIANARYGGTLGR